ncbi:outer dense fiber protein 2 [Leuresthes tenuis]|uniref:outer dense fiber protein 2 n=1 Tax=Leuresthes tenuis TaxID=355514 RepID=UPI003B506098
MAKFLRLSHPQMETHFSHLYLECQGSCLEEANRTTTSAKSRDATPRFPNQTPFSSRLRLEILSMKITNRISDKGQLWWSPIRTHPPQIPLGKEVMSLFQVYKTLADWSNSHDPLSNFARRKVIRTQTSSPPIHVHINGATSVWSQKTSPSMTPQGKTKINLCPTATVKSHVPWIPSGKASTREASYKWKGPTYRLENTEPECGYCQSVVRLTDLTSENGEEPQGQMSHYEKRNSNTPTAVSSLKMRYFNWLFSLWRDMTSEQLSVSRRVIVEQVDELAFLTKDLEETERENSLLSQSIEKMLGGTDCKKESLQQQKDALLRKLMEPEVYRAIAAHQVSAVQESVSKPCTIGSGSGSVSTNLSVILSIKRSYLFQKLETFESANQTLPNLLRELYESQMDSIRLSEQKTTLNKRLADTESENAHLMAKLQEKDREVNQLSKLLDTEKDNAKNSSELFKSLESARAHLQGQLRRKEGENNRLTVEIKNLKQAASQQNTVIEYLTEQLTRLKQQAGTDREPLKRAIQAQKLRAECCEDTACQLSVQLLEMEKQLANALSAAETWKSCHAEEAKENSKLEIELSLLNSHISELTEQLQRTEDKGRSEREVLLDHEHGLTTESNTANLENQCLKATTSAVEEKLALSQSELQHVRSSITEYESLLDSYKIQVERTRAETNEYCARLAQTEQEAQSVREQLDQEIEEVRRELLGQLAELELLPEALQYSQVQLQEIQEREHGQERHIIELKTTLTDLYLKMDTQGFEMVPLKQKNKVLLEENKHLQQQVQHLERKQEVVGCQNYDLVAVVAKVEKIIHSNQLCLEEKKRECSLLSQKLEKALDDAYRQMLETRERATMKECLTQSKILELVSQLSRTTSDIDLLQCSKDEAERRYHSQLQDMKNRLEQSDRTNRNLQNYVQFLKVLYSNVSGDVP